MKKIILSFIILSLALATLLPASASAPKVTVTVANGEICAHRTLPLSDLDGNGALTINDALIALHDDAYDGGSAAGYSYYSGPYGTAIAKLWGIDNGGSYSYCVNDQSAMSLDDVIKDGDHVYAYLYTDLVYWSDTYSYFSLSTHTASQGEEVELTLYQSGYDESFNVVTLPVSGATLTVNGNETDLLTDENGRVTVQANDAGTFLISAKKEGTTLVPPVMTLTVTPKNAPQTSDFTLYLTASAAVALSLVIGLAKSKRKI